MTLSITEVRTTGLKAQSAPRPTHLPPSLGALPLAASPSAARLEPRAGFPGRCCCPAAAPTIGAARRRTAECGLPETHGSAS